MNSKKLIPNCDNCEFNMGVCTGRSDIYGKPVPGEACKEWECKFDLFMDLCDEVLKEKEEYNPNIGYNEIIKRSGQKPTP